MSDSSLLEVGLINALVADAALTALVPDGVWYALAPEGSERYVIVSLILADDADEFGRRAFEDALYLVEARVLSTTGGNALAAAARIDAVLDGGAFTSGGYSLSVARTERVRDTEFDDVDRSIRWDRAGGRYRVHAALV